jgi:hypothetical protein
MINICGRVATEIGGVCLPRVPAGQDRWADARHVVNCSVGEHA